VVKMRKTLHLHLKHKKRIYYTEFGGVVSQLGGSLHHLGGCKIITDCSTLNNAV